MRPHLLIPEIADEPKKTAFVEIGLMFALRPWPGVGSKANRITFPGKERSTVAAPCDVFGTHPLSSTQTTRSKRIPSIRWL